MDINVLMQRAREMENQLQGIMASANLVVPKGQSGSFDEETAANMLGNLGSVELAMYMDAIGKLHSDLDDVKKEVGKLFDYIRTKLLPDKMESEGLDSMKVAGLGTVVLTSDMYMSVADKDAAYRWLIEIGSGDLIVDTVNSSSLKALLRRRLQDGEEIPEGLFRINPFTRASIRSK